MNAAIARSLIPVAVLIAAASSSVSPHASPNHGQVRYRITQLSSLGGTNSRGNSINNLGWVTGYSNLADNQSRHASLWLFGHQFDLGTLGGPNSSVAWPVKNHIGLITGIAQTATRDPLGEQWSCRIFFPPPDNVGYTCLGFAWEWGVMRALPTLGGNNGYAAGSNNRRQIVGWAENAVRDATCVPPQQLQFHAVVWGPGRNQIRKLPPLPGDTSGAATAINDRGQVVGISGICDQAVGRFTAKHAVIWEDGAPTDIGHLGGDKWNTPVAINERGDIAGFASQPGGDPDNPILRAFFWTRRGGIRDLDTIGDDLTSQAAGMNSRRQVVGSSCPAVGLCRAFLWQDDGEPMVDLNDLAIDYPYHLENAMDINDFGVITGRAINVATNERFAVVATPVFGRR